MDYFCRNEIMDIKKLNFIIDHFGCYTPKGDKEVLTSLGTMSFVPAEELWQVFTGDISDYFQIEKSEKENELVLILDDVVRKKIEREIEYERTSEMNVGFGWEYINNNHIRCYLEDESHHRNIIPFLFALDDIELQGAHYRCLSNNGLDSIIFDKAYLAPVNSGATDINWKYLGESAYTFKGGKYGSINKKGIVQIPLIYDKCIRFTNPHTAIALKDGEKLLINKWGERIRHNYDDLVKFYGDFCLVKKGCSYGIIDYNLNVIVPIEYDDIKCNPYTALLYINSHCGLFDLHKRSFIINIAFDDIIEHRDNKEVFSVCINNKWGLVNQNGDVIVPLEYKYIISLRDRYLVDQNGKYGVVDKNLSSDHCSWEWKDTSFATPIPCIYDEVYDTQGEINHTEHLFNHYRFYFAIYDKNEVQIDCYYKWYREGKGGVQFFTYERLDSLYCEGNTIKQTIVNFEKKCEKRNNQK